MSALARKLDYLESKLAVSAGENYSVVGLVCPDNGLVRTVTNKAGDWQETTLYDPEIYIPVKLESVLGSRKRFIIIIGGRGSGKSVGIADISLMDAKDTGSKTYCLREYQSSIKNSVHSLLKEENKRLELDFDVQASSILYNGSEAFQFAGLARNVDSIKSAHGFKRYWAEESQFISDDSLTALTPTARKKPKKGMPTVLEEIKDDTEVSIVFVANPGSSEDPFSKRFIVPFQEHLDRDGFYEDDLHLIVVMNYTDNPWYKDSGLEDERLWDYHNRDRALYDHIWKGAYNDSVENSLILAEWFDACIDAHKKKGFEPLGIKQAAHDPSDGQIDSKGYVLRHGSVVLEVNEMNEGNVNEGGHWATGMAINHGVDVFTWDCDGMGVALNEQVSNAFNGKSVQVVQYKGSESPDFPDMIYEASEGAQVQNQKKNKEVFRNKRAQYYFQLRDRVYRTYRAVVHDEYQDPSKLISFSSDIKLLSKLRAELCRIPVKPDGNGLLALYTKEEMKNKFKVASPNLADSLVMAFRYVQIARAQNVRRPTPNRPTRLR